MVAPVQTRRRAVWLAAVGLAGSLAGCGTTPPSPVTEPSASPAPAFSSVTVTGIGAIRQGGSSPDTLVLSFNEASVAAYARGPGSFELTINDHAGSGTTVRFTGAPSTARSPGSLGASATIIANVLTVRILDSDTVNIEPIIVTGIGISVSPSAAIGPVSARMGGFTGSLAGGTAGVFVAAPADVVAGP